MALTVKSIFELLGTKYKLKLLAGKNGLNNYVSWIYYSEDSSTIDFIRGGEIVMSLGMNYERNKDNFGNSQNLHDFLKSFIDKFIERNASAVIINIGKYIQEIPESIIELCNKINFPLFTMPWEIHTVDVMQEVGNMIATDNQNSLTVENFFYNGIFLKEKFDKNQIKNTSFYDMKEYSIAILDIPMKRFNSDIEQIKRYVKLTLNMKIEFLNKNFVSFIFNQKVIYIIKDNFLTTAKEIARIAANDKFFYGMKVSLSDSSNDLDDLPNIYNHALSAFELGISVDPVRQYNSLGIYKLLVEVKNQNFLKQMYEEILGNLNDFPEDKFSDYMKTLQLFLEYGGNIQQIAEHNNTHRNTVIYRIKKIEEILNIDLQDGDSRCLVQIALYIKKLLEKQSQ